MKTDSHEDVAVMTHGSEGTVKISDTPRVEPHMRRRTRVRPGRILLHLLLATAAFSMFAPFIWMVLSSFKTLPQLLTAPLSILPDPWTFLNFGDAWDALPFAGAYWNSFYITVLIVLGGLLTTSMAGYAFARMPFPS